MIGRMKPILNVLSDSDRAQYTAHYCGICAATKESFGHRAALGHSSELVFVSLLLEGLAPGAYASGRTLCTALPIIPRRVAVAPPPEARAIAAGVLATLQLDLKDAREDRERRIKQFLCRSLAALAGPIDPREASRAAFVQAAIATLPADGVAEVVAGVIGSVFRLAGHPDEVVAAGCRIGHALGRLMNLSDALDDYFQDLGAGRANTLSRPEGPPDDCEVERRLYSILDELDRLVAGLPLRRHRELLDSLINVHSRVRVDATLARYRTNAGTTPGPSTRRPVESRTAARHPIPPLGVLPCGESRSVPDEASARP
jgi:hypothetical protein